MLPRFYPILDVDTVLRRGLSVRDVAREIVSEDVRILQFRHKGFFSRQILADLREIAAMCGESGAMLVVNDRADVARLIGASLHLGQEDLRPSEARRIMGADALIGYSTHNEEQLRSAAQEPADYLALGPIFGTASKRNHDPMVGVEELRRLRPLTDRPLAAIGGITRANARIVIEAGADSVAVIGDLYPERGGVGERVREWLDLVER
ncbi:MAG TPA: thiamine phosphate synthase [Bryobacteraceae bacterium]|nr:thiamine phosphate synthase [Bryobacteraceae bacterium]